MTDHFRKDAHTKMSEKITPNSSKSTMEKLKEGITDSADRVARDVQLDSSKSDSQAMMDKTQRMKDRNVHGSTHETIGDKMKGALGMGKHH